MGGIVARSLGIVLASGGYGRDRVACSCCLPTGPRIALVAQCGARLFLAGWSFVLVARCAALATGRELAWVGGPVLPFPRHFTLRHSLLVPCVLWPRYLPIVSCRTSALPYVASPGPGMRRRGSVGIRNFHLLDPSSGHHHANAAARVQGSQTAGQRPAAQPLHGFELEGD